MADQLTWRRVITIHNNPDNLTLPATYAHLRIEMPDIDTANITAHFDPTFNFIEEGRVKGHGARTALAAEWSSAGCSCSTTSCRSCHCLHDCPRWHPPGN